MLIIQAQVVTLGIVTPSHLWRTFYTHPTGDAPRQTICETK